jgi:Domain of unknown function (DUF4402)
MRGRLRRAGAAAILLIPTGAAAATLGAPARVTIRPPVTLAKTADLEFGSLLAGAAAGTVVINPNSSARTRTGGVTLVPGAVAPAQFTATGAPNTRVTITLPNRIFIARIGGGAQMRVRAFRRQTLTPAQPRTNAAGALSFRVGATLDVGANQLPGRYTGTFNVTVNYL